MQQLPRAPKPHDPVLRAVRRHPFLLGSLALHAAALWMASQLYGQGLARDQLRTSQAQIQAHTQAAAQHGMRRRVDSLKAMKSLVERIAQAQAEPGEPGDAAPQPAPGAGQPETPAQTALEMLAQARELRDSIQRIEQAAQARKLAEVLNLAPEQALQKLRQQADEAAVRDAAADAAAATNQELATQALDRYEQQAREALQRLQAQHAQDSHGTPIQHSTTASLASHQGSGAGPGGKAGSAQAGAGGAAGRSTGGGGGRGGSGAANGTSGHADGRQSSVTEAQARLYDGQQQTPEASRNPLRLGAGNALGPAGDWSNRVYVNRWYVIGPFHAPNAGSMHKVYPPEQWVDLDGVYQGKGQRVLRWQYLNSAAYPLVPPDYAEQAVYYGYTEIRSDRARSVWMALGADDDAKLWVNDQLVWTSGNQRKAWYTDGGVQSLKRDIQTLNLIEERRLVHLRKGRNTLLFKLYNSPLDVFFSLVIEPAGDGD